MHIALVEIPVSGIHPFPVIITISLVTVLSAGIALLDIPGTIGAGFSGTFTPIGIGIILGALNTGAMVVRGIGAGSLPLTDQYEFAASFAQGSCRMIQ